LTVLKPRSEPSDPGFDIHLIYDTKPVLHVSAVSDAGRDVVAYLLEHSDAESTREQYALAIWEQRRYSERTWECKATSPSVIAQCRAELAKRNLRVVTHHVNSNH
jgi:hypothetical protein